VPTHTPTNTPTGTHTNVPTDTPTNTNTPTATATTCVLQFEDVHPTDWFYGYVEYMYCHGVISGYHNPPFTYCTPGADCFAPSNHTTRGQTAKIVVLAFGFPIDTTGGPHFSDVPVGSTFYTWVETANNLGLVNGFGDGTYRPNSDVTRGQIAKIVVSAAVIADPANWQLLNPPSNTFEDVLPGSAFYQYVETAAAHNVVTGYACGTPPAGPCGTGNKPYFLPSSSATRAQISKIVYLAVTPPPHN
jgi:S-layer homology domain